MAGGVVLLTGASGLLGTWLLRRAPGDREIVAVVHRRWVPDAPAVPADLRDPEAVRTAVRQVRPSLVVHAAYARDHASIVGATRHVAAAASEVGAGFLLVSTDAVFSGDGAARDEQAVPDPAWDYGRWKAQAERIVSCRSVPVPVPGTIVRLPLIVSLDPDDHVVERIRSGAVRGEATTWFTDELRQPARARELADGLWRIASLDPAARAGTWHLPGPESLSRYEIAQRVVAALDLPAGAIRAGRTPPEAGRPRDLRLRDDRAKRTVGWSPSRILS